jgi:hypothetical protein
VFQKVQRVAREVRDVADDAQADIGHDYIWLADVTYHDWQRYHDLVRSECFRAMHASVLLTCASP